MADGDRSRVDFVEQLYVRERTRLLAIAFARLRCREDAEQVVQDAYLELCERRGTLEEYEDPAAWLRLVVYRRSSREADRRGRFTRLTDDPRRQPPEVDEGDLGLLNAIEQLPERQRQVIL